MDGRTVHAVYSRTYQLVYHLAFRPTLRLVRPSLQDLKVNEPTGDGGGN